MGTREELTPFWPLMGLELRTPRLVLRPICEDDVATLLRVAAAGVHEPDVMPFLIPWTVGDPTEIARESLVHYWRRRAEVGTALWNIQFGVANSDGELMGAQGVMARQFLVRRSVDTGSWLGRRFHGNGYGTEMRAAVLAFAFDHLGATRATSGALDHNVVSQRVSARLGYHANGVEVHDRAGDCITELRFLVTPETFRRPAWHLEVRGWDEACRSQLLGAAHV